MFIKDIEKQFVQQTKRLDVLCGITHRFYSGRTYAITGRSGSGKSTLLHIVGGLEAPTSGVVCFNEKPINHARQEVLLYSLGMLFQAPYLIKECTVLQNVMLKGLIAGRSVVNCLDEAYELLQAVGIEDKSSEKPSVLSGGQQQRVALARALFGRPAFLLADEPTGHLDTQTGRQISSLILSCQKRWGMGVILSTHDGGLASEMDEQYTLIDGFLKKDEG